MKEEPIILAIETAVGTGSLSVLKGDQEIAYSVGERDVSRSEDLVKMIKLIFESVDLKFSEVDLISVSIGPGSFTGVRVGLAVAKALAFGLGCSGIGVSLTDALAFEAASSNKTFGVVVPAGRSQISWQLFNHLESQINKTSLPSFGSIDDLKKEIEFKNLEDILLILELELFEKIHLQLSDVFKKNCIVSASDNVSRLTGLCGWNKFKTQNASTEDQIENVVPKYLAGY